MRGPTETAPSSGIPRPGWPGPGSPSRSLSAGTLKARRRPVSHRSAVLGIDHRRRKGLCQHRWGWRTPDLSFTTTTRRRSTPRDVTPTRWAAASDRPMMRRFPPRWGPRSCLTRSIGFCSPSVHPCDDGRCPSLDASPSASSSSPPKNCPLCRSRMGPLGGRVDFGRRCASFRGPRGAASGPNSRRASPRGGGHGAVTRGSAALSGEGEGGADACPRTPGPGSRARTWLTTNGRP
jgi:hypothetical protein